MAKRKYRVKKQQDGVDISLTSSPFKRSKSRITPSKQETPRTPTRSRSIMSPRTTTRSPMRSPMRTPMRSRMSPRKPRAVRNRSPTPSPATRFMRSININDKTRRKLFGSPIIIVKKKKKTYIPRQPIHNENHYVLNQRPRPGRKFGTNLTNLTWI